MDRPEEVKSYDRLPCPSWALPEPLTNTVTVMGSIFPLLAPEYAAAQNIAMDAVMDHPADRHRWWAEAIGAVILVTAIGKALLSLQSGRPAES